VWHEVLGGRAHGRCRRIAGLGNSLIVTGKITTDTAGAGASARQARSTSRSQRAGVAVAR
jgi:hypothetical protein